MGKLKLGTAYRVCDACSTPLAPLGSERAAADALLCDACMGTYRRLVAEVTRPVLRWHGGKFLLAPWVISHFPKHRIYVEPFGGAASVLLQKPRSYGEVYNDLNGDVVNLFQVLRDPELALTLANMLRLTPFSRVEFKLSYVPADCQVERARRLVVRCFQGFVGVPPAGDVTRFQPLRGIARFYYARPFGFLPRGGLRKYLARKCAFVR